MSNDVHHPESLEYRIVDRLKQVRVQELTRDQLDEIMVVVNEWLDAQEVEATKGVEAENRELESALNAETELHAETKSTLEDLLDKVEKATQTLQPIGDMFGAIAAARKAIA